MKYSAILNQLLPRETAFAQYAEVGYDFVDYDGPLWHYAFRKGLFAADDAEFDAFFTQTRQLAADAGIGIGQVHAPFWITDYKGDALADLDAAVVRSVRATALMDCKYMVFHPMMLNNWHVEHDHQATRAGNIPFIARVAREAERCGIYAALENMPGTWNPAGTMEEFTDYLDSTGSPALCACLDTGHANVNGISCADAVRILGSRLKVLHIHDNNGQDTHGRPGTGTVDWKAFAAALKEYGYSGTISHEANVFVGENGADGVITNEKIMLETLKSIFG